MHAGLDRFEAEQSRAFSESVRLGRAQHRELSHQKRVLQRRLEELDQGGSAEEKNLHAEERRDVLALAATEAHEHVEEIFRRQFGLGMYFELKPFLEQMHQLSGDGNASLASRVWTPAADPEVRIQFLTGLARRMGKKTRLSQAFSVGGVSALNPFARRRARDRTYRFLARQYVGSHLGFAVADRVCDRPDVDYGYLVRQLERQGPQRLAELKKDLDRRRVSAVDYFDERLRQGVVAGKEERQRVLNLRPFKLAGAGYALLGLLGLNVATKHMGSSPALAVERPGAQVRVADERESDSRVDVPVASTSPRPAGGSPSSGGRMDAEGLLADAASKAVQRQGLAASGADGADAGVHSLAFVRAWMRVKRTLDPQLDDALRRGDANVVHGYADAVASKFKHVRNELTEKKRLKWAGQAKSVSSEGRPRWHKFVSWVGLRSDAADTPHNVALVAKHMGKSTPQMRASFQAAYKAELERLSR